MAGIGLLGSYVFLTNRKKYTSILLMKISSSALKFHNYLVNSISMKIVLSPEVRSSQSLILHSMEVSAVHVVSVCFNTGPAQTRYLGGNFLDRTWF